LIDIAETAPERLDRIDQWAHMWRGSNGQRWALEEAEIQHLNAAQAPSIVSLN